MARKLTDAMTLNPFFHQFAKNGQVYVITNNPTTSGLEIPLKEFQESILDMLRKTKACRTHNDDLRLSLTMLDPKYREAVSIIMTNKIDRVHSDIAGNHVLHFFEQLLTESYSNAQYRPPQVPREQFGDIDEEELSSWDANDPKIFEVDRTAAWLMETWKVYVKHKYKAALDRWNKETGGGTAFRGLLSINVTKMQDG